MSIAREVKGDIAAAKKMRLPRWGGLYIIIGTLPVLWLFDHFGRLYLALPILVCVGDFALIIAFKWRLRRRAWFWLTIGFAAAFHVPLIMYVPWTSKWVPALAIAGIASVDFCAILWLIDAVGRFVDGPGATGEREEIGGRPKRPRGRNSRSGRVRL